MIKNAEIDFTSFEYDTTNLENGLNEFFNYKQLLITLTTVPNQRNDMNNSNVTSIDIKDCEKTLRDKYNLSDDVLLYMKKIEVKEEGMKIPKIEFDIYIKLNGTNLIKLNLSYCEDDKIEISIPFILDESIEKHNSSSDYYNNICYPTTSESGTDIILKDRQKEFIDKNKTACQENCVFTEYDNITQKAKCSCNIMESSKHFVDIYINKTKLYKNFVNIKNIANIDLLICYKELFKMENILHNYLFFLLFPIIIIHFILMILFVAKHSYDDIVNKIKDIKFGLLNSEINKTSKKIKEIIHYSKENKYFEIILNKKIKNQI